MNDRLVLDRPRGAGGRRRLGAPAIALAVTLAAPLFALQSGAQEIPTPITKPCNHPCVSQIRFKKDPTLDIWKLHARIIPISDIDPPSEDVTLEISNVNDVIFAATLAPGDVRQAPGGRRFYFRDPTARLLGGVERLFITQRFDGIGGYRVDAVLHGDLSLATLAEMTVRIVIGNDPFVNTSVWLEHAYGWSVDFPPP
jgi:hypothetical protein